jgi:hypothetical protein
MSKAASSEKRIVSAFIALHGGIPVNMLDYHQPENTFIFNVRSEEIPSRYKLYAPDVLGRSYILTDPSTSNFIYEKIEEWKRSPMSSRPASPRARSVSSRARSASPRSRPEFFSEFIAGELTHFEQTDTEAIFNSIDDMYKESQEKQNGMKSKELKKDISHMRTSALLKNEVKWKKHDYCIGDKDYIVPSDSSRVSKATIDPDKEIIVVIETFKNDDESHSVANKSLYYTPEVFEGEGNNGDRLSNFMDKYLIYCNENLYTIFPKTEDAQVADAVLELFRKRENLDIFNKKALYIYIREMVDIKTSHITKVSKKLHSIFKDGYTFYLEHGRVKF